MEDETNHDILFLVSEHSLRHMLDLSAHAAAADELMSDLLMRVSILDLG